MEKDKLNEDASKEVKVENKKEFNRAPRKDDKRGPKRPFRKAPAKEFEEVVLDTKAVVKVTKGGRQRRFQAVVLVGDKKGLVGLGTGKANEIVDAVRKARQEANKNMVRVPIVHGTIPHESVGIEGASRVIVKPCKAGTGIKAGGAARAVLEMSGIKDITSKTLGSRKKINVARATLAALSNIKTIEQVAAARGKSEKEIIG